MHSTLLMMAAGMGSRFGGMKQLDAVGPDGETLLEYSVFEAIRAGFGKVVYVIRRDIEYRAQRNRGQVQCLVRLLNQIRAS
jgi:CTP:molybdopterin cytidylyltransferase MocA